MRPVKMVAVPLFEFIIQYKETHDGNSPTYREMRDGIGVSIGTIHRYIHRMIGVGLISMVDGKMCLREGTWKEGEWEYNKKARLINERKNSAAKHD